MIPLRGHHGGSGTVTFWIMERPGHGTLSELRLLGDNRANIVYQHDGTESSATDGFRYAVKSSSGLVSTPAAVRISVEEPPARLHVPERIVYDHLVAGTSQTRRVTIENEGGGILEGRLTVSAPWKLDQVDYRVPAGGSEKIAIIFQPDEGKDYVGQLTLSGEDGSQSAIELEGSASLPITLEPERLRIDPPDDERTPRAGSFALTNQTDEKMELTFESGREFAPIAAVSVDPRATRRIPIVLLHHRSLPVHEEILVKGDGFMARLPVDSEAAIPKKVPSQQESPAVVQPSRAPTQSTPTPVSSSSTPFVPQLAAPAPPRTELVQVDSRRLESPGWELSWPQPKNLVSNYRVEERQLALDGSGELQTTWRPVATSAIAEAGDSTAMEIKGLAPDQLHMVKVTALAADGTTLWESPILPLSPPRPAPQGQRPWLFILCGLFVALVVWRWRIQHSAG
ncbi:MAG: hypothetical protein M3Q46_08790 [Verrucomicrobiota bacterium]|nr:hypothetical protein [Verrucomicrobiota bacterium]